MAGRSPDDRELAWYVIVCVLVIQVGLTVLIWRLAPYLPAQR